MFLKKNAIGIKKTRIEIQVNSEQSSLLFYEIFAQAFSFLVILLR